MLNFLETQEAREAFFEMLEQQGRMSTQKTTEEEWSKFLESAARLFKPRSGGTPRGFGRSTLGEE